MLFVHKEKETTKTEQNLIYRVLNQLAKFCNGSHQDFPNIIKNNLESIFKSEGFKESDIFPFFNRVTFVYLTEELNTEEKDNYFLLADMLDVVFDKSDSYPIKNLKSYISKKKVDRNSKHLEEIKLLLKPLEDEGFKFTY